MSILTVLILWFLAGLINVVIMIAICMIEQKDYNSFARELSNESDSIVGFFFSGILGFIVLSLVIVITVFIECEVLEKIYNCTFIRNLRERWNK